jgi:hypothetical protein
MATAAAAEKKKFVQQNETRIDLTPTGLLMEGVSFRWQTTASGIGPRNSPIESARRRGPQLRLLVHLQGEKQQ